MGIMEKNMETTIMGYIWFRKFRGSEQNREGLLHHGIFLNTFGLWSFQRYGSLN